MDRVIYIYQNEEDFSEFYKFLKKLNVNIYSYHTEKVKYNDLIDGMHSAFRLLYSFNEDDVRKVGQYKVFSNDITYIEYNPCRTVEGYIYEGSLILHTSTNSDTNEEIKNLFKEILKFIKKNYILTYNRSGYVASKFFEKWNERKISTPWLLQAKTIVLDHPKTYLDGIINYVSENGYAVTTNEDVIIFNIQGEKLDWFWNNVSPNSKCIFLVRYSKYYIITLDIRLLNENHNIVQLFNLLEDYVKNN